MEERSLRRAKFFSFRQYGRKAILLGHFVFPAASPPRPRALWGTLRSALPAEGKSYSDSELPLLDRPIKVRLKQLPTNVYKLTDWVFRRRNPLVFVVPEEIGREGTVTPSGATVTCAHRGRSLQARSIPLAARTRRGAYSGRWVLSSSGGRCHTAFSSRFWAGIGRPMAMPAACVSLFLT